MSPDVVLEDEQIAVFDDVLPAPVFADLLQWANAQDYRPVHHGSWRKVWRLHDGMPLSGSVLWHRRGAPSKGSGGLAIDVFIDRMRLLAERVSSLVGAAGDWEGFSVTPWVYPSGSGLSLHADTSRYTGAFTYFLHPEWHIHWGGMLVVLDPRTSQQSPSDVHAIHPPWLSDASEQSRVWDPGLGRVILPKPNRVVFIGPQSEHLVTRVDPTAGQNARISLAGFFHKVLPDEGGTRPIPRDITSAPDGRRAPRGA